MTRCVCATHCRILSTSSLDSETTLFSCACIDFRVLSMSSITLLISERCSWSKIEVQHWTNNLLFVSSIDDIFSFEPCSCFLNVLIVFLSVISGCTEYRLRECCETRFIPEICIYLCNLESLPKQLVMSSRYSQSRRIQMKKLSSICFNVAHVFDIIISIA